MPQRSKVMQLPPEIKSWLDTTLAANNFSGYESLSDELSARGFSISKSSLGRYGQNFEERLSSIKLASEQAKAVVDASPDDDNAVNEALMRLVQEHLFKLLMSEGGKFDLAKVARSVATLGRASVTQKKFSTEQRKEAQEEARREMLAEQEDRLEEIRGADGMSEQMEERIRSVLLGKA